MAHLNLSYVDDGENISVSIEGNEKEISILLCAVFMDNPDLLLIAKDVISIIDNYRNPN